MAAIFVYADGHDFCVDFLVFLFLCQIFGRLALAGSYPSGGHDESPRVKGQIRADPDRDPLLHQTQV